MRVLNVIEEAFLRSQYKSQALKDLMSCYRNFFKKKFETL